MRRLSDAKRYREYLNQEEARTRAQKSKADNPENACASARRQYLRWAADPAKQAPREVPEKARREQTRLVVAYLSRDPISMVEATDIPGVSRNTGYRFICEPYRYQRQVERAVGEAPTRARAEGRAVARRRSLRPFQTNASRSP
jgi:hypothetical protein